MYLNQTSSIKENKHMATKKDDKKDEKKGKPMPPWVKGKKEDPKKMPAKKAPPAKKGKC